MAGGDTTPDPHVRLDVVDSERTPAAQRAKGRPSIRVMFTCANAYCTVLRSPDGGHYRAVCPKCGLAKKFLVGPNGTGERLFSLSCA